MAMVSYIRLGKNIERCTRRATMRYVRRMLHRELRALLHEVDDGFHSSDESPYDSLVTDKLLAKIDEVRALIVQFGGRA